MAKKQLSDVGSKIDKMMNAIMDGLYTPSMKEKMDTLEEEKSFLMDKIEYLNQRNDLVKIPTADYLLETLRDDLRIKGKSLNEQKRIIQTYVQEVIVYPDHVEIYIPVRGYDNGAEGS